MVFGIARAVARPGHETWPFLEKKNGLKKNCGSKSDDFPGQPQTFELMVGVQLMGGISPGRAMVKYPKS